MAGVIVPVARAVYLCDRVSLSGSGKVDIHGVFNLIRAAAFPSVHPRFTVFAQLVHGLGTVRVHVDIRRMSDWQLVHASGPTAVTFQARSQTRYIALTLPGVPFHRPGMYAVELLCNNTWVADASLELAGVTP